ncbi:hypothetical protein KFK09_026633 [Dendrobium nobile]|uniref:CCHC-type domain-containing protein n=1 Tax=Dendrobium nobile TaxID=94219 RepID=A0A8T3A990_DENNO|nr:hypothetical protein KFK09_026633 [Dendrobium nobile]
MPAVGPAAVADGEATDGFDFVNMLTSGCPVKNGNLVIREPAVPLSISPILVPGKGKEIVDSRKGHGSPLTGLKFNHTDGENSSSSDLKIFVNHYGNSVRTISESSDLPSIPNPNGCSSNVCENVSKEPVLAKDLHGLVKRGDKEEDGCAVKLFEPNVKANSDRLNLSIVVKVFGADISIPMMAWELRRQWNQFGKFHLTSLGLGWMLCSFDNMETMENVIMGGPWFVKGHIIGLDRWSSDFSPSSLKGLSSPVWVRLPNLPLFCWDEINVARIASLIGTPLLLDGNMFQWSKREFGRVCVRLELDKQLPLGVWVDGPNGRFFQKVEYERISSLCYNCGKVGHLDSACGANNVVKCSVPEEGICNKGVEKIGASKDSSAYGPWIHVFKEKEVQEKSQSATEEEVLVMPAKGDLDGSDLQILKEAGSTECNSVLPSLSVFSVPNSNKFDLLNEVDEEGFEKNNTALYSTEKQDFEEGELVNSRDLVYNGETKVNKDNTENHPGFDTRGADLNGKAKPKLQKELKFLGPLNPSSRLKKQGGANKREAPLYLKEVISDMKAIYVGIVETKIDTLEKWDFNKHMGKDWEFFLYPSNGSSGGIVVLWRSDLASFSLITANEQCVIGKLCIANKGSWIISTVYGSRDVYSKRNLWDCLGTHSSLEVSCDLHDVGVMGPKLTWCNNKSGGARIWERLDRCLLNSKTLEALLQAVNRHVARVASDHCPVVLQLNFRNFHHPKIMRSKHNSLKELKEKLKKEVDDLQNEETNESGLSEESVMLLKFKVHELNTTLARLNVWWRQRVKVKWIKESDINSQFFHSFANGRKNGNLIKQIKDGSGNLVNDQGAIEQAFLSFFSQKWKERECKVTGWPNRINGLSNESVELLDAEFTMEEIEKVISNLGSNISPGIDGISYSFIKGYWKKIAQDIREAIFQFISTGKMNEKWKETLIVLIPKVQNPESNSLLYKTLRAKYGNVLCSETKGKNFSVTWKILSNGMKALQPILRWNVVTGDSIDPLEDIWIQNKRLSNWPTFVNVMVDEVPRLSFLSRIEYGIWGI